MSKEAKVLIVCSIGHGKNFSMFDNSKCKLIVEAECCSEKLESDPIELISNPNFSQELAWEVSRHELHQLRSSRIPLKLVFFVLKGAEKIEFGYIPLDIRTIKELPPPPEHTWRKLVVPHRLGKHSKSHSVGPQVSVSLYSEIVGQVNNKCDNILKVELDSKNGFFQIGKHASCCRIFVLSVTVLSASNLARLIPSDSQLECDEFSFYYEMLGNKVQSDTFWNIVDPGFSPERASLRLRSSLPMLQRYFQQVWSSIEVKLLCGGSRVMASGKVSLSEFVREKLDDDVNASASVDCILNNGTTEEGQSSVRLVLSIRLEEESQPLEESSPQPITTPMIPVENTKKEPLPNGDECHHFSFTINISSVEMNFCGRIYIKYDYMFFGAGIPFTTMPAINVETQRKVGISNGTCTYDFATTWNNLTNTLCSVPLRIEIWMVDEDISGRLHDVCDISLGELVKPVTPVQIKNSVGSVGERRFCSFEAQSGMKNKIQINICLDNWGILKEGKMDSVGTTQLERQATLELELWRARKEEEHEQELAKLRANYLSQLTEEWKTRHSEREALVKRKVDEYDKLTNALRVTLAQFTQREEDLNKREHNLKLEKAQFEGMRAHHETETRAKLRQTQMEHQTQLQREQNLRHNLECQMSTLQASLSDSRANEKMDKSERDTSKILEKLAIERDEWKRKFDHEQKIKNHYKQSWGKALGELATLRAAHEADMLAQLKKKDIQLKKLKSHKNLSNQADYFTAAKTELKTEIANKQLESESIVSIPETPKDYKYEDHIARLIEERDSLLRTGVYSNEDKIIVELDREIRESVNAHNN